MVKQSHHVPRVHAAHGTATLLGVCGKNAKVGQLVAPEPGQSWQDVKDQITCKRCLQRLGLASHPKRERTKQIEASPVRVRVDHAHLVGGCTYCPRGPVGMVYVITSNRESGAAMETRACMPCGEALRQLLK